MAEGGQPNPSASSNIGGTRRRCCPSTANRCCAGVWPAHFATGACGGNSNPLRGRSGARPKPCNQRWPFMDEQLVRSVQTDALWIAYVEHGPTNGWPVILSHGFPYDVHAFDEVASILTRAGARVIAPYTRGFGPTRFVSDAVKRSGQQAARGCDIVQLADALGLERPILGGFDWGGNASCVAAALWPERIGGLVSYAGYDIIDVSKQRHPVAPSLERVFWYQHLFQTERGRECLIEHRCELCRLLWDEWSPGWHFDEATFARSAVAFDNPDFVDVVIHCYRWLFRLEAGDLRLQPP